MNEVTLQQIECTATEDVSTDHCLLEIRIDGQRREPYAHQRELSAGEKWEISRTYPFDNGVELTLKDEDLLDPDDVLGTNLIEAGSTGTVSFDQGDADYTLAFSVDTSPSSGTHLDSALDNFTETADRWSHIEFQDVKNRVQFITKENPALPAPADKDGDNVDDIYEIDQGATPFCGVAAVVFGLAYRQPRRYVELARSLFETGAFFAPDDIGEASGPLRRSPVPQSQSNQIHPADWMVMASLRDSKNWFDSVTADDLQDQTMEEVQEWTEAMLGYTNATYNRTDDDEDFDALEDVRNAHAQSGLGLLYINAEMVGNPKSKETRARIRRFFGLDTPNHVVTYLDGQPYSEGDPKVILTVQTWGDDKPIDPTVDEFHRWMSGAVTGWP